MKTFLEDMISKTLKNRPVAKVLSLCIMAAYAATFFDVTGLEAFSLEWCLALAKGTAIKSLYICAPIAVYGSILDSIIEDASIKAEPAWLSDLLFDIYRHISVFLGIASWLILVTLPALVISECGIIATGGAFSFKAVWVSVTGSLFLPETLIEGFLWLSRAFAIFYYMYCLIAPIKVKEEPVVGKGIVGPMKPPKKITRDKEDAA